MTPQRAYREWRTAKAAGYRSFDAMQRSVTRRRRLRGISFYGLLVAIVAGLVFLVLSGAFARGAEPFATGKRAAKFRKLMPLPEYRGNDVLFYTEREMPRCYQLFTETSTRVHDPRENVAAFPDGMPSNANREFPWGDPGGMHNVPDDVGYGVQFIKLPHDSQGRSKPIVWWYGSVYEPMAGHGYGTWLWRFPVGAVVGEMLVMHCPDGRDRVFEVRLRFRQPHEWAIGLFRPFGSADDLADAIVDVRPDWRSDPKLAAAVARLRSPRATRPESFVDRHVNPAVRLKYSIDVLPALPAKLVGTLLDRYEFVDTSGGTWRGDDCFAPTAKSFHVVPVGYAGHAIGNDNQACAKCHNTVGRSARSFTPGREWYGRVRGNDDIFSYHIFEPSSIGGGPVRIRPMPSVLAQHDKRKHRDADYPKLAKGKP